MGIERFLAGALLPADWYLQAQRSGRCFGRGCGRFSNSGRDSRPRDALSRDQRSASRRSSMDGVEVPARPNIGVFTQPLSFIGLPMYVAFRCLRTATMPLGVQVIGAAIQRRRGLASGGANLKRVALRGAIALGGAGAT